MDERMRPIDRASLVKGYQDVQFKQKERQSLDLMKQAVDFIKVQVEEKREKLRYMEN